MVDETQFQQIVRDSAPALRSVLVRFVRRADVAEELLQETWMRAWRGRARIDVTRDPLPWFRKIAVHCAIDWLRANRAMLRPLPLDDAIEAQAPASPSMHIEVNLGGLDPTDRAALLLYYQEGYSIEESALILGVPPGTVKTWLFRARRQLKEQLRRRGGELS